MTGSPSNAAGKSRAPTLYAIIVMKILKGLSFAVLALIIYTHSDRDTGQEIRDLLQWLKLNPEGRFWANILAQADNLTEARMIHFAFGTLIYSLFSLVEGVGLLFRVPWAGWLSIGESAFFVPIEMYELAKRFHWYVFVIMVINVFIVFYLYANRERLFHRHR